MKPQAIPVTYKSHDAVLLFLAALALVAELSLLLHQLRLIQIPFFVGRSVASSEGVGEIVHKARSVQNRSPGSLTWYPVAEGDSVRENDTVMTGASSSARIQMRGGGELALEPLTLLRFSRELRLADGRLALEVNRGVVKIRSETAPIRIALQDRELAVKPDSEVVLSFEEGLQNSGIEVTKGSAQIAAVSLKAGEAVSLTQGSAPLAIVTRLHLDNIHPAAGSQVFFRGSQASLDFHWSGDSAEFLEWDQSPQMRSARRVATSGNKASASLTPGKYFWRLVKGHAKSSVMAFTVLPQAEYRITELVSRQRVKEGMEIPLRWERVPEAQGYRLEVSRDGQFKNLERTIELKENEVELKPLPVGKYYWRLKAQNAFLGDWPASAAYEIRVRKRIEAPTPKGAKVLPVKPPPKKPTQSFHRPRKSLLSFAWRVWSRVALAAEAPKVWLEFSWESMPHAKAYRLEISHRKDFKKVISSTEGTRNSAVLQLPEQQKYFWRVAAVDEDGDLGKYSAVQTLRREQAKVVAAPLDRKPAQIPLAPVVPQSVLKDVRADPMELPRDRYFRTWFGYGATYMQETANGELYLVRSNGIPLHRLVGGLSTDFAQTSMEFHAWYQPLYYRSAGAQSSFTLGQWGADFFWSRLFYRRSFPLGLGLRTRSESLLTSVGNTSLTMRPTVFTALLIGTSWEREGRWPWKSSLWLELGPVGEKRGAGLIWRNRLGLPMRLGGMQPSVELLVHPQFRIASAVASSEWNLEVAAALVLQWTNALPSIAATTH